MCILKNLTEPLEGYKESSALLFKKHPLKGYPNMFMQRFPHSQRDWEVRFNSKTQTCTWSSATGCWSWHWTFPRCLWSADGLSSVGEATISWQKAEVGERGSSIFAVWGESPHRPGSAWWLTVRFFNLTFTVLWKIFWICWIKNTFTVLWVKVLICWINMILSLQQDHPWPWRCLVKITLFLSCMYYPK